MKTPTQWSNNDVKAPAGWTPAVKNQSQWANNAIKNPTQFTPVGKTATGWKNKHPSQLYHYDDAHIPYDSLLFLYDSMVNNNTENQRLVTKWSAN